MSQNFNVTPYFDDFDPSKNFHRILFKPGVAVQARELTQTQTILQSQISKFADHIFTQNSPVSGGKITTNLNCYYLKLNYQYNNVSISAATFLNKTIQDSSGTILAKVIAIAEGTGVDLSSGDPPTLVVVYLSGTRFTDGMYLAPNDGTNIAATTIGSSGGTTCTGLSSVASISDGVFYVVNNSYTSSVQNQDGTYSKYSIGSFVSVQPQTIILSKYSNVPSYRIGLNITDAIIDYTSDVSLLDPAVGASNYQAPGADRYQITLTLTTLPLTLGSDDNFIEIVRINAGVITKHVDDTVYSVIDDYFAKRTLETNGDYIVNDFALGTSSNTADGSKYILTVGPGTAYVQGYRVDNQSTLKLNANRARTTAQANNNVNYLDYGNYLYVDNVRASSSGFFDATTNTSVDLHTVPAANIAVANATTYTSTLAATAYLRNLIYQQNTSDANTLSYVYKAYVYDVSNKVLTGNVSSATSTTITFFDVTGKFSAVANAYYNVTLTIDSGTNAGDTRLISSYNASTKTATVNSPFSVTPDTTSNFSLRFSVADIESMISATSGTPYTLVANSTINNLSRVNGLSTGDTILNNTSSPELLFPIGNPYVANVLGSPVYTTIQEFRNQAFTTAAKTIDISAQSAMTFLGAAGTQSADAIKQNIIVAVTSSTGNTGEILSLTTGSRTVSLDVNKTKLTITVPDIGSFTATVYTKMSVVNGNDSNYVLKTKTLVNANTLVASYTGPSGNVSSTAIDLPNGQVYVANSAVVGYGSKQYLYVSDVKNIVKIIDTRGAVPTLSMLTASGYDVTANYTFYDGQTDNYYGHSWVQLNAGAPKPTSLWILFNYYSHSGGDGYFVAQSYPVNDFGYRKNYTAKSGITYSIKDCLDFRPAQENAQSAFKFRLGQPTGAPVSGSQGLLLPVDLTTFTSTYTYYLGRKDILTLGKDSNFNITEGIPNINPFFPAQPTGSMLIAQISSDPYTSYIPSEVATGRPSNMSIQPIRHKRWQMKDITDLQTRVNNLEYYTSLNLVEQKAATLQIPDALGLNRFKNGILVDDFSTFNVSDTYNADFSASVNTRMNKLEPALLVDNYQLQNQYLLGGRKLSSGTLSGIGFTPSNVGNSTVFTLPYTETVAINQPLASRTTSVNPFTVVTGTGTVELTPPMDNWVDRVAKPAVLFVDPNLKIYDAVDQLNLLDGSPTLALNDWQTLPGTTKQVVSQTSTPPVWYNTGYGYGNSSNYISYVTETTTTDVTKQNQVTYGNWSQTYNQTGEYLTNVSILPYIRTQQVSFEAKGMLINTNVDAFFDGVYVTSRVRKPNQIELTSVSGTFAPGDSIGYTANSVYYETAKVLDVYKYANTANVRLYVVGDLSTTNTTSYTTGTLVNALFNTTGVYQTSTASGTLKSQTHYSGKLSGVSNTSTNVVTISNMASSNSTFYTGLPFNICAGTINGANSTTKLKSITVSSYNPATRQVTLSANVVCGNNDIYSIGALTTNEVGSLSGVFYIPGGVFQTGQKAFRLDNRIMTLAGGTYIYNSGTETTSAEATFYATGLQKETQEVNYAASIHNAKNMITQSQTQVVSTSSSQTYMTIVYPVVEPVVNYGSYDSGVISFGYQ